MQTLNQFKEYLIVEEKSELTIDKYLRDVRSFLLWLGERDLSKALVVTYKTDLAERYAVSSVNSMLSSINSWLSFVGRGDCRVKFIKRQRQVFLSEEKELSKSEYIRLIKAAERKPRLRLLMQTICATGIRVSEHEFITVEAARAGQAEVRSKGKQRIVFLEKKLCKALLQYAKERNIRSGSIFITSSGKPLNRCSIWAEMKKLCDTAGVSRAKVFPHNLRHLFARLYYGMEHDIVRLADILGHSSINTTRIYTMDSGRTHRQQMKRLQAMLIT